MSIKRCGLLRRLGTDLLGYLLTPIFNPKEKPGLAFFGYKV
jgi:hypothetical protein